MAHPTPAPSASWVTTSTPIRHPSRPPGWSRLWESAVVRMTATGSLSPDSSSRVTPTRRLRESPLPRSTANTDAASVDDTTAPSSSASGQESPQRCASTAISPPVSATPTVARSPAGAQVFRTSLSGVLRPPSNRMSASASDPSRNARP
jgi:hypothetical protein